MELIPILATIILMATMSTFFLAIGAYVLYKIRERKGIQAAAAQPTTIKAELVTPEVAIEQIAQVKEATQRAPVKAFDKPNPPMYKPAAEPIFVQQKAAAPAVAQAPAAAPAPQPAPAAAEAPRPKPAQQNGEKKFMKYTSEGYVEAKEDKAKGQVKWR